jgi:hypothetical protein
MRSLALWVTINFTVFAKLEGRENVDIPGAKEIADLWGSINKKYAVAYLEKIQESSMQAKIVLNLLYGAATFKAGFDWLGSSLSNWFK